MLYTEMILLSFLYTPILYNFLEEINHQILKTLLLKQSLCI